MDADRNDRAHWGCTVNESFLMKNRLGSSFLRLCLAGALFFMGAVLGPIPSLDAQIIIEEKPKPDKGKPKPKPKPKPKATKTCPDGQELTRQGECCWPGQSWKNKACTGTPSACPEGLVPDAERESCELPPCPEGKARPAGTTTCCWVGQKWSESAATCTGEPTACPKDMIARNQHCEPAPKPIEPPVKDLAQVDPLTPPPTDVPPSSGGFNPSIWSWVSLGTGLALVGTGVALHFVAEGQRDDVRSALRGEETITSMTRQEALDKEASANTLDTVGLITMSVGGAAVIAGALIMAFTWDGDSESDSHISGAVSPDGALLFWTIQF